MRKILRPTVIAMLMVLSSGCGGGGDGKGPSKAIGKYRIGGVISGLYGDAKVIINGLSSFGNGVFIYLDNAETGESFSINATAPEGYRCETENGSGSVDKADWLHTKINCQLWQPQPMQNLGSADRSLSDPVYTVSESGHGMALWPITRGTLASEKYDREFGWQPIQGEIDTDGLVYNLRIESDAQGNALAVWLLRNGEQFNVDLYAAKFTVAGGWEQPVKVADVADQRTHQITLDLAMDEAGNAVVAWLTDLSVKAVGFSFSQGWEQVVMLSSEPLNTSDWRDPLNLEVVIDESGNALLVWEAVHYSDNRAYSKLHWTRYMPSSGWEPSREIPNFNDEWYQGKNLIYFDVAMSPNGDALMAWVPSTEGGQTIQTRDYSHSGGWSTSNGRLYFADSLGDITGMKITANSEMMALTWVDRACCMQRLYANVKPAGSEWQSRDEIFSSDNDITIRDIYSEEQTLPLVVFTQADPSRRGMSRPYLSNYVEQYGWNTPFLLDIPDDFSAKLDILRVGSDDSGDLHIFSVISDDLWHQRISYKQADDEPPAEDNSPQLLDIVGGWSYQLGYSSCPNMYEYGTAHWSYHADGYGLIIKTNNVLDPLSCSFQGSRTVHDGGEHYLAGSPISAPEFLSGLNDFSNIYNWYSATFLSENGISVDGRINQHRNIEASLNFSR